MDIIEGVKEGAKTGSKIGLWAGIALGVACGLVATTMICALGGIALPGVLLTMHLFHSTLLTLSQVIGGSAIAMTACTAAGTLGGWLTGIVGGGAIGGAVSLVKPSESRNDPPSSNQQSQSQKLGITNQRIAQQMITPNSSPLVPMQTPGFNASVAIQR